MADEANGMLASDKVLRMLRQIEAHPAALRNGAHGAESQWLTIAQAAKELQVARDTVERLIAAGKLLATEEGRYIDRPRGACSQAPSFVDETPESAARPDSAPAAKPPLGASHEQRRTAGARHDGDETECPCLAPGR